MKPKTMILMGLAIVCGLGASYMTSRLLAERTTEEPERVKILIAKRALSVGERIRNPEELFEFKEVTKENEPPDAVKEFDQLKNKIMKQSRNKGEHVTPNNINDKDGLDIPEGHQAVGVPVNLATTAHGLATLPGSRVDLILTIAAQEAAQSSARVLLENVLVLAADGRTNREGEIIAPAQVVTFALKDDEALKVKLAERMGALSLSLRKLNDDTKKKERVIHGHDIFGEKKKDEPAKVAEASPPPPVVVPVPEVPKGEAKALTILNGFRVERQNYRVLPNGDVVFDDDDRSFTPRPAIQPQPQPQPAPADTGKGQSRDI